MELSLATMKKGAIRTGLDLAGGTGALILAQHANKIIPEKFVPVTLLVSGMAANLLAGDNSFARTVAIVTTSIGAVKLLNQLGMDNGIRSDQGYKGIINKFVPSLGGVEDMLADIDPKDLMGIEDLIDIPHTVVEPAQLSGFKFANVL